jgi:small subunit ribosomal protein S17
MEPETQNQPEPSAAETAPAAQTSDAASDTTSNRGRRQVKQGVVVSNKMDKTVVVAVENVITHRLYHRYLKRTSKFHAHDEANECKVGDVVELVSSRPLSRTKRWRVRRIVKRAE